MPHSRPASRREPRPYIGLRFDCCGTYTRVYRKPEERAYRGRCPRCLLTVTIPVAPGGTASRLLRVDRR